MPTAAGLYYFAHGADDRTRLPVVLIHGAGGDHLYWPPEVRRLENQRIFAVDLPGHGKSEGVGHHSIEDYAAEILAFLKALKIGKALLIGHSMGGAVALQAAITAPRRVVGLGLVGSAARLRVSPSLLQIAADPSKVEDTVRFVIESSFAQETSPRLKELAERRMLETRSSVLYGDFLACEAFEPDVPAAKLALPVLMIFGEQDKMVPSQVGRALQEQVKNARLEIVPAAGHMVMLEQPERVAELLGAFIESVPYQPGK